MDVHEKIDEVITLVENARGMPMSASCVVNRGELVTLLREVKDGLPEEFHRAEEVLRDREAVVEEARQEAERIIAEAREQRDALLSETEVAREAGARADEVKAEAMREAYAIRQEVDDYVDQKLANFEVVLNKTLSAVNRGRDRLRGRQEAAELGEDPPEAEREHAADRPLLE